MPTEHGAVQFSLPTVPANEAVFATIVSTHDSGIVSLLLDRYGRQLSSRSEGLMDYLRVVINHPIPIRAAWDYAFGRAHLALKEGKVDPVEAAIRVGICYARAGHYGSWSATLSTPGPLQIGPCVAEGVTSVQVDSGAGFGVWIRMRLQAGDYVEWHSDGGDDIWHGPWCEALGDVGMHKPIWLLNRSALPVDLAGGDIFRECEPVEQVSDEAKQSILAGIACLQRNAGIYITWIERVLNGLVVSARKEEFRLVSGSWEDAPGLVHLSCPHAGIDIAEILVHESAHQYFYMLQRVGPVDDASDSELYWSPPIRKARPLSRILMAYHALANTELLYEAVRRNPDTNDEDLRYVLSNQADLRAALEALDVPLRDNPALTDLGRGLYVPLADRLSEIWT